MRCLLLAGVLACLTASCAPEAFYNYELSLQNRTHSTQPVALYRAASLQDCPAIATGDLSSLAAATFALDGCFEIAPAQRLPFGSIIVGDSPPADAGAGQAACQAVVVRVAGLADTVLAWQTVDTRIRSEDASNSGATLYLEAAGDRLYLARTTFVDVAPASFPLPASGCAGLP